MSSSFLSTLKTHSSGRLRSKQTLLPVHSCASTAAKSTRRMRSDCSYDLLVSAHRSFEPAKCNLQKLFVSRLERGAIGHLHGLGNMTMGCMNIYSVVLPSTRPTGRVLSTAGGRSCSSAPRQLQKKGMKYPLHPTSYLYLFYRVSTLAGALQCWNRVFNFDYPPPSRYSHLSVPLSAATIREYSSL